MDISTLIVGGIKRCPSYNYSPLSNSELIDKLQIGDTFQDIQHKTTLKYKKTLYTFNWVKYLEYPSTIVGVDNKGNEHRVPVEDVANVLPF